MIIEFTLNPFGDPPLQNLDENYELIWIEALKNIKQKMMARNYDIWYLKLICHAPLDYKFQNPMDIVDGMLRRALEAHPPPSGNSNSSASATADPELSIVSSIPTLTLNQNNPALEDQPPPYCSITNDANI